MRPRREFTESSRVRIERGGLARAGARPTPRKKSSRATRFLLGFLFLGSLFLAATNLPELRISKIDVVGLRVEDPKEVRAVAEKELEGTYALFIPRDSIFFYPAESMRSALLSAYPRFASASIRYRSATAITIELDERRPVALWCPGVEECAFLDGDGFAFARAPRFSGNLFFEIVGSTTPQAVGQNVLSTSSFYELMALRDDMSRLFKSSFSELGLLAAVDVSSPDSYAFSVQPHGENSIPWKLIVEPIHDRPLLLKNVEAALHEIVKDAFHKNEEKTIEYVDARLGRKIFYKLKDHDEINEPAL